MARGKFLFCATPLLILIFSPAAMRADSAAAFLAQLQRVIVLENGRLKPLDSVAQDALRRISGKSSFEGKPAAVWLERVLFFPEEAYRDEIFRIPDPEVLSAMGITREDRKRYSFAQLSPGLDRLQRLARMAFDRGEKERSAAENEIIRLYRVATLFYELASSMQWVVPRESLRIADPRYSTLAVIPAPEAKDTGWLTAWEIDSGPAVRKENALRILEPLRRAVLARREGRLTEAEGAIESFNDRVRQRPGMNRIARVIGREILFNRLDPFSASQWCYGLALLFILSSFLLFSKWLRRLAFAMLAAGLSVQALGIALRMAITGRPPVTNLYETFLFVAWVGAVLGAIIELASKKSLGILAGAFAGFVFLLISGRYALEGDTMGMLVAVLNTNLWLAVHVATVTMGYAGCVVAGVIGHVYIVQTLTRPRAADLLASTDRGLYAALAFGLVFTFLGTVMGGIWADQSWGRFWGWDPKENGALLIILWVTILFHARKAGIIGRLGMAGGSVISIVTVVLAWFGVNLLGVGMHAYGFMAGVNKSLTAFVLLELIFLAVSLPLSRRKR
jgi:ABC-type transport system involved in cytochrome c biogenesis permease subunit